MEGPDNSSNERQYLSAEKKTQEIQLQNRGDQSSQFVPLALIPAKWQTVTNFFEKYSGKETILYKDLAKLKPQILEQMKDSVDIVHHSLESKGILDNNYERAMKSFYQMLLKKINPVLISQVEKQFIQASQKKRSLKTPEKSKVQSNQQLDQQGDNKKKFKHSFAFSVVGLIALIFNCIYLIYKQNQSEGAVNKCPQAVNGTETGKSSAEQSPAQQPYSEILNFRLTITLLVITFFAIIIPPFVQKYGDKISSKCSEFWRSIKDCLGIINAVTNQMQGS